MSFIYAVWRCQLGRQLKKSEMLKPRGICKETVAARDEPNF